MRSIAIFIIQLCIFCHINIVSLANIDGGLNYPEKIMGLGLYTGPDSDANGLLYAKGSSTEQLKLMNDKLEKPSSILQRLFKDPPSNEKNEDLVDLPDLKDFADFKEWNEQKSSSVNLDNFKKNYNLCNSNKNRNEEISCSKTEGVMRKAEMEAEAALAAQNTCGDKVAKQVRQEFAEIAIKAAEFAKADLFSKQETLQRLENDLSEAEYVRCEAEKSYDGTINILDLTNEATKDAVNELNLLTKACAVAEHNLKNKKDIYEASERQLLIEQQFSQIATNIASKLRERLRVFREDLENSKDCTKRVLKLAAEAQQKAQCNQNSNGS